MQMHYQSTGINFVTFCHLSLSYVVVYATYPFIDPSTRETNALILLYLALAVGGRLPTLLAQGLN